MDENRDERIRRRAHEIWEREGRPEGRHDEHWSQAAAEIDSEGRAGTKRRTRAAASRDVPAQMRESLPEAPGVLAPDTVDTVRKAGVRKRTASSAGVTGTAAGTASTSTTGARGKGTRAAAESLTRMGEGGDGTASSTGRGRARGRATQA